MRHHILFICTGNSARSIIAESIVNHHFREQFTGFSAGSHPLGYVQPDAIALLREAGHDISTLSSKSWDIFGTGNAPHFDFVFTVCDGAADEICPVWPSHPVTAHWGMADPAKITQDELRKTAFERTYQILFEKITLLSRIPFDQLDKKVIKDRVMKIG